MANRAYMSVWTSDRPESAMLDRFERLLETVPVSTERPGLASLIIRAVSPSETPLLEQDLRNSPRSPAEVMALAREHLNADSAYEVEAFWDLWQRDAETGIWRRGPERLFLVCHGEAYDDGVAAEAGHFLVDLGFEHLFTGHAGLLGPSDTPTQPASEFESSFITTMREGEALKEYGEKTRENIHQLLGWVDRIERTLPVTRCELHSEGEKNFEARLDEILAVR